MRFYLAQFACTLNPGRCRLKTRRQCEPGRIPKVTERLYNFLDLAILENKAIKTMNNLLIKNIFNCGNQ